MSLELKNISLAVEGHLHIYQSNLRLEKATMNVLLGPTLSGKTTLMRIMAGLEKPSSGQIIWNGKDITNCRLQDRDVAMVYQQFINYPTLSVYENIAFAAQIFAHSKVKQRNMVLTALEKVNLGSKANHKIHMLSGGERQRCAIARAIVNNPYLLIADEPTGNLDPQSSNDILELLKDINAQGMTVVLVTHDKQLVDSLNRRVVLMQSGCITRDLANSSYICA